MLLTEAADIKNRWKEYCYKLYEEDPKVKVVLLAVFDSDNRDEPNTLMKEVEKAVNKMKNEKAPGIDHIPAEMLKSEGAACITVLHKLCNRTWDTGIWPDDWRKSVFLPVPKREI